MNDKGKRADEGVILLLSLDVDLTKIYDSAVKHQDLDTVDRIVKMQRRIHAYIYNSTNDED